MCSYTDARFRTILHRNACASRPRIVNEFVRTQLVLINPHRTRIHTLEGGQPKQDESPTRVPQQQIHGQFFLESMMAGLARIDAPVFETNSESIVVGNKMLEFKLNNRKAIWHNLTHQATRASVVLNTHADEALIDAPLFN